MIVIRHRNGDTTILGQDNENLLKAIIQFAIDEGELHGNKTVKFAGTPERIKLLKSLIFP